MKCLMDNKIPLKVKKINIINKIKNKYRILTQFKKLKANLLKVCD